MRNEAGPGNSQGTCYRVLFLSPAAKLIIVLQICVAIYTFARHSELQHRGFFQTIAATLTACLSIPIVFQLVNLLLLKWPVLRRLANLFVVATYCALLVFEVVTGYQLGFDLIAYNLREIFHLESLHYLISQMDWFTGLLILQGIAVICWVTFGLRLFDRWPQPRSYSWTLFGSLLAVLLLVLTPLDRSSAITYFARTAINYYWRPDTFLDVARGEDYPYLRKHTDASLPTSERPPRPNIFLIMMESFNARFVSSRTDAGQEYTPFFNSIIRDGVYVKNFYGNSMQTSRGQIAILCSIIPSFREKEFVGFPELRLKSIAAILSDQGYATYFFKGYKTLDFDNTGAFCQRNGFQDSEAMSDRFISAEDEPCIWGWGLQDDRTYQKVFKYLDERHSDGSAAAAKVNPRPQFVCIHTLSHHAPFDDIPTSLRFIYPNAETRQEDFANSMYLADRYLREFFVQLDKRPYLRDSIVIITGDHSFPAGEHGIESNEVGYFEESFRTPLLIIWKNHLHPKVIDQGIFSQLDIAPTLLDLLQINVDNHFLGRSVFNKGAGERVVPLVQPYNGTYLCAIHYPYKYVRRLNPLEEHLYDLQNDPGEDHDIFDSFRDSQTTTDLKKEIEKIYFNQSLIEHNRIWPGDTINPSPSEVKITERDPRTTTKN